MPSESLTYKLFGVDVNASRAISGVGKEAKSTADRIEHLGIQTGKWGGIAAGAAISTVGLAGALGVGLAGAVAVGAAAIATQVPKVAAAFKGLGQGVKDTLIGLSGPVQDALINVVNHALQVFNQLTPTLKAIFQAVGPVVNVLGKGLVDAVAVLVRAIPGLLATVQPLIDAFGAALVPLTQDLVLALKNMLGPTAQNSKAFGDLLRALGALLPVIGSVLGLVVRLGGFLVEHFNPVLVPLAAIILGIVAAIKVWTIATKAYAVAQAALNFILAANPIGLVVLAIVGLIAIVVVIATKTRWFQNIWNASWGFIKRVAMDVWNWIKSHWPLLLAVLTGPIGAAAILIIRNWNNIKNAASAAFTAIVSWFKGLPGRITGALGNLGSLLTQKGKDVIQGFWDGLVAVWKKVTGWISGLSGWIRDHKGPPSLDRNLLFDAGHAIMDGFFRGLRAGGLRAFGFVKDVAPSIAGMLRGGLSLGLSPAESWIIAHESGGRTTADNPISTAFGLGQLLLGNRQRIGAILGFSPSTTNFAEQLAMFRYYYRERYGTAEAAKAFWQAHGWYGSGMAPTVFTRPTLIGVGEAGPETVSVTRGFGGGGGVTVNVRIGTVVGGDRRRVAADLLQDIREDLRRRGKGALADQL